MAEEGFFCDSGIAILCLKTGTIYCTWWRFLYFKLNFNLKSGCFFGKAGIRGQYIVFGY